MTLKYREIRGLNIKSFFNPRWPRRHHLSLLNSVILVSHFCRISDFPVTVREVTTSLKLPGKIPGTSRNTRKVYGDLPGDLPGPMINRIFSVRNWPPVEFPVNPPSKSSGPYLWELSRNRSLTLVSTHFLNS